jgi:GNAT superfamily N-acetyltransferase
MAGHYEPALLAALLPLITVANPRLLASGRHYVAVTGTGEIAGCGGWSHERPGTEEIEPGLGHIRHFGTHPGWTGRGIGRALLERCLHDSEREGVTCLECYANLNAEGFYRALGFAPVQPVRVSITPQLAMPALLMRRVPNNGVQELLTRVGHGAACSASWPASPNSTTCASSPWRV